MKITELPPPPLAILLASAPLRRSLPHPQWAAARLAVAALALAAGSAVAVVVAVVAAVVAAAAAEMF